MLFFFADAFMLRRLMFDAAILPRLIDFFPRRFRFAFLLMPMLRFCLLMIFRRCIDTLPL